MCRRTVPLEFSFSSTTSTIQEWSISGWTWGVDSSQPARQAAPFLAVHLYCVIGGIGKYESISVTTFLNQSQRASSS